jgi:hypothetical protein
LQLCCQLKEAADFALLVPPPVVVKKKKETAATPQLQRTSSAPF